ncbi:MAG: hypothetical protein ISS61_01130 [Desulfobacteraceae bacterium]|nr:hypothetical protein [Desulfobacteraceae bacterium]
MTCRAIIGCDGNPCINASFFCGNNLLRRSVSGQKCQVVFVDGLCQEDKGGDSDAACHQEGSSIRWRELKSASKRAQNR